MGETYTIKEKDTVFSVGDLIEALKDHKDKKLMVHVVVKSKEEGKTKYLVCAPEILGYIDGDRFNFTLQFGEWELEE